MFEDWDIMGWVWAEGLASNPEPKFERGWRHNTPNTLMSVLLGVERTNGDRNYELGGGWGFPKKRLEKCCQIRSKLLKLL